jgi:ribonuclease D
MGRWKRKQEYYKKKSNQNKESNGPNQELDKTKSKEKTFNALELARLKSYLRIYRDGCYRILKGDNREVQAENLTIGDHVFPELTSLVLSLPYMVLPSSLSAKERHAIHELAYDLDLYHTSMRNESGEDERLFLVSIFADGFQYLPENWTANNRREEQFHLCKPWFCRSSNNVKAETIHACKRIESLIDQPSCCIRDDRDFMDYNAMNGVNLSIIAPISSLEDDRVWMLVDSEIKMKKCAQELLDGDISELGFDLEFYNPSKHFQVTCLLQLTSNLGKDYVIDTLAPGVWDNIHLLQPLFGDSNVVKIGHGISGDVQSLHRDFGIFVVNVFDTYEASKVMNLPKKGLAYLCEYFGIHNSDDYIELKRMYQSCDWRHRPLTKPMISYGRYDVHYLVQLRKLMIRDLTKAELWKNYIDLIETQQVALSLAETLKRIAVAEGDVDELAPTSNDDDEFLDPDIIDDCSEDDNDYYTPNSDDNEITKHESRVGAKELRMHSSLMQVISCSQQKCLHIWKAAPEMINKSKKYIGLLKQAQNSDNNWTNSNRILLEDLMHWRSRIATREECLEGMVCSIDLLVSIALKRPLTEAALRRISYTLPYYMEDAAYQEELLSIVHKSHFRDGLKGCENIPFYRTKSKSLKSRWISSNNWVLLTLIGSCTTAAIFFLAVASRRRLR